MTVITNPLLWKDVNNTTPPAEWQALAADSRYWFDDDLSPSNDKRITYIGPATLPTSLAFAWEILTPGISGTIRIRVTVDAVAQVFDIGNSIGSGIVTAVGITAASTLAWEVLSEGFAGFYSGIVAVGDAPEPPPEPTAPVCDELGRATRAYVSAYDRARVHQSRLYRFERRCLVANFNGAIPPARTIVSATWRTDSPYIGVISTPLISTDQRETTVMLQTQLSGWANLRAEVTLDNGEIYNQVFRVNVREASVFNDDPALQSSGPFSVSVSV